MGLYAGGPVLSIRIIWSTWLMWKAGWWVEVVPGSAQDMGRTCQLLALPCVDRVGELLAHAAPPPRPPGPLWTGRGCGHNCRCSITAGSLTLLPPAVRHDNPDHWYTIFNEGNFCNRTVLICCLDILSPILAPPWHSAKPLAVKT